MRVSTAYFAGAGTVVAAIVGGVGGGLLIADMISPKLPKGTETTRLERRMSPEPIQASEPAAAEQSTSPSSSGAAAAPVPTQSQTQTPSQGEAKTQTADQDPKPAPAQPVDAAASTQAAVRPPHPKTPAVQPAAPEQTAANGETAAKTRDADLKRSAEKRRAERRQQWVDKRRHQQRQEQELQGVEETVRAETEPRREFVVEPERLEMRRIRLFGEE